MHFVSVTGHFDCTECSGCTAILFVVCFEFLLLINKHGIGNRRVRTVLPRVQGKHLESDLKISFIYFK